MSLRPQPIGSIPEQTAHVAHAAFSRFQLSVSKASRPHGCMAVSIMLLSLSWWYWLFPRGAWSGPPGAAQAYSAISLYRTLSQ